MRGPIIWDLFKPGACEITRATPTITQLQKARVFADKTEVYGNKTNSLHQLITAKPCLYLVNGLQMKGGSHTICASRFGFKTAVGIGSLSVHLTLWTMWKEILVLLGVYFSSLPTWMGCNAWCLRSFPKMASTRGVGNLLQTGLKNIFKWVKTKLNGT